jgi:hypothetical protein
VKERPDTVATNDVENSFVDRAPLLDNSLRRGGTERRVSGNGRADGLAGLYEGRSEEERETEREQRTLTTQIGFEKIEVATPAEAETRIDSRVERVARLLARRFRTRARASSNAA